MIIVFSHFIGLHLSQISVNRLLRATNQSNLCVIFTVTEEIHTYHQLYFLFFSLSILLVFFIFSYLFWAFIRFFVILLITILEQFVFLLLIWRWEKISLYFKLLTFIIMLDTFTIISTEILKFDCWRCYYLHHVSDKFFLVNFGFPLSLRKGYLMYWLLFYFFSDTSNYMPLLNTIIFISEDDTRIKLTTTRFV